MAVRHHWGKRPLSATSTPEPITSRDVVTTTILFDAAGSRDPDEYVEIRNADSRAIRLQNWTLRDATNHVFTFPNFVMDAGQTCRVYTNENHREWCSFSYGSDSAIWNYVGDTAYLRDRNGTLTRTYSY